MNVLQYRWYYSNGDDAYYIIGDSAITLTVTSVLQYRLVITLSVLITLSVVTAVKDISGITCFVSGQTQTYIT